LLEFHAELDRLRTVHKYPRPSTSHRLGPWPRRFRTQRVRRWRGETGR
jgi:hypothetical protein